MRRVNFNQPAVASSETARDINRRIVLNAIRNQQPISRADVARFCGLQRSTVSIITESLIEERWVIEGSTGRLPRGRRPTFLHLNDERAVVCVDIRPVAITIGVGDVNGLYSQYDTFPTPPEPGTALKAIVKRVRELSKKRRRTPFEGIGVSVPGRIDLATHQMLFAPNLRWPLADIKGVLEKQTGLPVEMENAANACALAEMWFSRREDVEDLVTVTVSEGIGTGLIAHGQLITGRRGMAGEFGHVPLDPDGPLCCCGNRGCWETLASNRAALRYYFEARGETVVPGDFTFRNLLDLADGGEPQAVRALTRMAVQIGRGTRMIVAALAPQMIVFVGEFTSAWDRFRPVIEAEVQAQNISREQPRLEAAEDGANARIRGTIALVFQKHFGASTDLPDTTSAVG